MLQVKTYHSTPENNREEDWNRIWANRLRNCYRFLFLRQVVPPLSGIRLRPHCNIIYHHLSIIFDNNSASYPQNYTQFS